MMSGVSVHGQISTEESPVSFSSDIVLASDARDVKTLPALDMETIHQEDEEDEQNGVPPRFGYRHEVNYSLNNSGTWTTLPNDDKIWQLEIYCPEALSINLLYDKFHLPESAKFFVFSSNGEHSIGAFTSANNKGDVENAQGFATGLIYGDRVVLEYYLPKDVEEQGIISVAYVVHGYRYIMLPESVEAGYGESGSCQVNVNCGEGQNWQQEKNAVAMILVNGNRYCSGSLVNTTAGGYRPLFLTADHCLGGWANDVKYDAITDSLLNHWSFYWHYESPGCTGSVPPIKSTSGAVVVANNSASDFALLRLSENPRNKTGVTPYYLGWDRSGSAGTGGVGIHHPVGDVKKIATLNHATASAGNFWEHYWDQTANGYSVTEGGSSGSPLINNNHRVIGQLYGGSNINCSNPSQDLAMYGKFSVSWTSNGAADNRRKLQPWLDPAGTNPTTLNGIAAPSICPDLDHNDFDIAATSEGSNMYGLEATANVSGIDQYEWELASGYGWTIAQHPYSGSGQPSMYRVLVTKGSGGSAQAVVRGRPHNCAGWSEEWIPIFLPLAYYSVSASLGSGGTTLNVNIDVDGEAYEAAISQSQAGTSVGVTSAPVFTVKLYNSLGTIVRQTTAQAGTVSLGVSNLPNGYYILHVYDGSANPPQTQNIIISH